MTFRFRGKTEQGKWYEGDLINYPDGDKEIYTDSDKKIEVIPSTVGLISSMPDSTGKLIAEGDKLKVNRFTAEVIVICDFDGTCFNIKTKNSNLRMDNFKPEDLTIVGTIHD